MRVRETVVRPFGNSASVTILREVMEKYFIKRRDRVELRETSDGMLITAYDVVRRLVWPR